MAIITEGFCGPDDPIFSEGVTVFFPRVTKPLAPTPKKKPKSKNKPLVKGVSYDKKRK